MLDASTLGVARRLDAFHNVAIRVIDPASGRVVSTHIGHNASTNSMLTGIAHYLTGDGVLNQGYEMLGENIPMYISLGTMGLMNQEEDVNGHPAGIGAVSYLGKTYDELSDADLERLGRERTSDPITAEDDELLRFVDYITQLPGYGADGYDINLNNNREYFGLGPVYADRPTISAVTGRLSLGDINFDGVIDNDDLMLLIDHQCGVSELNTLQLLAADIDQDGEISCEDVQALKSYILSGSTEGLGSIDYTISSAPAIDCELISSSFPRSMISFRDVVPETESEFSKTVDVVFSAMISTGALTQFKEPGKDFLFVTEAGLWSRKDWIDGGDNGLLAGYRIAPPNQDNWDMTVPENREILKQNIIRIGTNQVVQVIWKIQLGGIEQIANIQSLYPDKGFQWIIWNGPENRRGR